MKVMEMASALGVTADTIRYYTRIGYLHPQRDPGNGYKRYGNSDLRRLRFILNARSLGFTVEDIGAIFKESDNGHSACPL